LLRLSTARKAADILWPEFREYDGAIVLANDSVPPPAERDGTLTEYERSYGHTHLQDMFRWDVPYVHDPEWDIERPDETTPEFAAAWEMAQRIARMWFAKLALDFPAYQFRVYLTKLDDPIVHFHRVRDDERVWYTDQEAAESVAAGTMIVWDTGARAASNSRPAI
jgi:hypothetical protein